MSLSREQWRKFFPKQYYILITSILFIIVSVVMFLGLFFWWVVVYWLPTQTIEQILFHIALGIFSGSSILIGLVSLILPSYNERRAKLKEDRGD